MVVHGATEVSKVVHFLSVNGNDQITAEHDGSVADVGALATAVQSSAISSASGNDLHDEDAVGGGQSDLLRQLRTDRKRTNAERWASHTPDCNQIIQHSFGGVDGNRK